MIDLDVQVVAWIALGSAVASLLLAVAVVVLASRLRTLRRDHRRAFPSGEDDVIVVLGRHADALASLQDELDRAHADTGQLRERLRGAVSRVGLVRYDAFDDMGGALSFSAALLDERGDGVVVSAINGRTETRCYAKAVQQGRSEQNLSDEEIAAIDAAVEGRAPTALPPSGRRRRRAS